MNIGEMDRRVGLYSYTETRSDTGEPVRTFTLIKNCFAKVEYGGGSESITADAPTVTADLFFTIRYTTAVNEKTRILYKSIYYNIVRIEEIERKVYLKLTATRPDND